MNVILGLDPGIKKKTVGKPAVFFFSNKNNSVIYTIIKYFFADFFNWKLNISNDIIVVSIIVFNYLIQDEVF